MNHPDVEALRAPTAAVLAHLATCPRCRIERRLLTTQAPLDDSALDAAPLGGPRPGVPPLGDATDRFVAPAPRALPPSLAGRVRWVGDGPQASLYESVGADGGRIALRLRSRAPSGGADRLAALLAFRDPGWAPLHAHADADGAFWTASPWVPGEPGAVALARRDRAGLDAALGHLAATLSALHDAGLAHGNLHADNVLFRGDDTPVVLDPALAGEGLPDRTRAPELAFGAATPAGDMYALGQILAPHVARGSELLRALVIAWSAPDPAARPLASAALRRLVRAETRGPAAPFVGTREAPAPTVARRIGETVTGRHAYILGEVVGRGAFGTVYRGRGVATGEADVAVKILHGGARMARRELASLLALDSDRVPPVLDASLGDPAFVVSPWYAAGSLAAAVAVSPLTDDQLWTLLEHLLRALDAAHRAALLHLDVKPSNVLLDGHGGYLLGDFGISRGSHAARDVDGFGVGTRGYQAAEQRWFASERVDLRTDLYGLGATVWSAATGIDLSAERARALLAPDPSAPSGLPDVRTFRTFRDPALPELLDALLHQAPAKRPGSAAEVLALLAVGRGRGVQIARPGRPVTEAEATAVRARLLDPLLRWIVAGLDRAALRYLADGDVLARDGELGHLAWVLLEGAVRVELPDGTAWRESREGTVLGEIAVLASTRRTATIVADGPTFVLPLSAAELESMVAGSPAVGIRLLREMARRLGRSSARV